MSPALNKIACLVLLSERYGDQVFELRKESNKIGRSNGADIRIPDPQISSSHALIEQRHGVWTILDLQSTNGTKVNGEPVKEGVLRPGDRLELGGAATLFFTDKRFDETTVKKAAPGQTQSNALATSAPTTDQSRVKTAPIQIEPPTALGPTGTILLEKSELEAVVRDVRPARLTGRLDERRLSLLYQLAEALGRTRSQTDLVDRALELTMALIPADAGYIFLHDPRKGTAPRNGVAHAIEPEVVRFRENLAERSRAGFPVSRTILDHALRGKAAVATTDASIDERFSGAESVVMHEIHAVMVAPILVGEELLGAIYLDAAAPGYLFSRGELLLLAAIAFQTGLALENAQFVKDLEDRVAERTAEIARLSDERARLLSVAAHDLKTPLSGMVGYLESLVPSIGKQSDPSWLASELTLIGESMRDMISLLSDLLDRQSAEAGRIELSLTHTELAPFFGELVAKYTRWATAQGRQIVLALPEDIPTLRVDRLRLAQVMNNLVHNAIKHTKPGGRVTIGAAFVDAETLAITVGDEGKGFDAAESGRLLRPFERGTATEPPVGAGHGLGLAIVDELVTLQGGRLMVESSPGRGARFTFTLPVNGPIPGVTTPARGIAALPTKK
jgi:signal transduction histidine kinase/pSer/pThr/pTyr-binding forkhead associated (FHA) protein